MSDGERGRPATPNRRPRLQLPYRQQSAGMLGCGLVLAVVAAVVGFSGIFGDVGPPTAVLVTIGAVTLLIMGLIVRLLSRTWERKLRRIEAGHFHIHWRYDDATWQGFRQRFGRRHDRLLWAVPLGGLATGLLVAAVSHGDGSLLEGSVPLTYGVALAGGAVAGFLVGLGARWLAGTSERLMARLPGECFIAEDGLYLTGQFWPWRNFGQRLLRLTLSEEEPRELCFTFKVNSTAHQQVHVPVPPGEEATAASLVADGMPSSWGA